MKRFFILFLMLSVFVLSIGPAFADGYRPINFATGQEVATDIDFDYDSPAFDIQATAKYRVKDEDHYYKVTVDDVDCNHDISSDDADAWIVNIDLTWDGKNGVPRTKTMLRFFGDDLAQEIFNDYSKLNISQLWCRWAVPYLYEDDGFIAKYKYEKNGDDVYMTESNGLLFNLPDNYK